MTKRIRKHKLTRRSLLNWAKRQAGANPKREEEQWDEGSTRYAMVTYDNSPQRELAMLAQSLFVQSISEYKRSDLFDMLRDFAWAGTEAYKTMAVDKLLDQLLEHAKNWYDEPLTVEDLVETANPYGIGDWC